MRAMVQRQLPLFPTNAIDHVHARELQAMSEILDGIPRIAELCYGDLTVGGADPDNGRAGMTADQVLRALLVKQMNRFSYEELAFHLADSSTYRAFCRLEVGDEAPSKSTLQRNVKLLSPQTLEAVNRLLVGEAQRQKVEVGRQTRVDCTVTASNIHEPTDSSLLWDCVRVLARETGRAADLCDFRVVDRSRRAKRRAIGILNAGTKEKRLPLYKDLLTVTDKTLRCAEKAVTTLAGWKTDDPLKRASAAHVGVELDRYIGLARRVVNQTRRRVILGESVPAAEKVVSIFEPHTSIIVKDRRETLYGHKLCLASGPSGLVTDCVVEDGNPADVTLAVRMVQRQTAIFGKAPRQAAFDGGFASKANLAAIKSEGVTDVCFSKGRGMTVGEMVKSTWVYRRLKHFRAGIEAGISFLKRSFGLDCCTWRTLVSFQAYVWSSVLSANLLTLARRSLG